MATENPNDPEPDQIPESERTGNEPNPSGSASGDEPPVPGGDPDQPPPDLPKPPSRPDTPPKQGDPEEYGHVGTDDRPQKKDRPAPRQIF